MRFLRVIFAGRPSPLRFAVKCPRLRALRQLASCKAALGLHACSVLEALCWTHLLTRVALFSGCRFVIIPIIPAALLGRRCQFTLFRLWTTLAHFLVDADLLAFPVLVNAPVLLKSMEFDVVIVTGVRITLLQDLVFKYFKILDSQQPFGFRMPF